MPPVSNGATNDGVNRVNSGARRGSAYKMFERFTEKAIKVIMLAQEEARRLGHNFVGTEFILLGLIGEGTGIAAKVLKSQQVNLKDARIEVEKIVGRGAGFTAVEIPFTPKAKRQLELAWNEAKQLGHNFIGTEHLLLALIRWQDEIDKATGVKVLENLGVDTKTMRSMVIRALGEAGAGKVMYNPAVSGKPVVTPHYDEVDETNKILFEAIVSALPPDIQPLVLNLREVLVTQEEAVRCHKFEEVDELHEKEAELLAKITEQRALSPEARKITIQLIQIRREKEEAIKSQEFEKAASLREEEQKLSDKLRDLRQ